MTTENDVSKVDSDVLPVPETEIECWIFAWSIEIDVKFQSMKIRFSNVIEKKAME